MIAGSLRRADERDILFSKVIWEIIDLDQKVNFPYLYPVDTTVVGRERRPLIHHLLIQVDKRNLKLPQYCINIYIIEMKLKNV